MGTVQIQGLFNLIISEVEISNKEYSIAEKRINHAILKSEAYQELLFIPYLLNKRGDILVIQKQHTKAIEVFELALHKSSKLGLIPLSKNISRKISLLTNE